MTKVSDVTQCKNVIIGAGAGSEVKSAGCSCGEAGLIHSLVVATAISNLTVSARGPDALFPSPQTSGRDMVPDTHPGTHLHMSVFLFSSGSVIVKGRV